MELHQYTSEREPGLIMKKQPIVDALSYTYDHPDFAVHASHLTRDRGEIMRSLMADSAHLIDQVLDENPAFTSWAIAHNSKLESISYPFHDGAHHPYEIALFQSLLLTHFTREGSILHGIPQAVIFDIIRGGIVHEVGLAKGRTGHEAEGVKMVTEAYPNNPLIAFGVKATTVSLVSPQEGSPFLVQAAVWQDEDSATELTEILKTYGVEHPTKAQLETLIGIMAYPDIKALILPSYATQTGILSSIVENILVAKAQQGTELTPQAMKEIALKEIKGTKMLTRGIQNSLEFSTIYKQLLGDNPTIPYDTIQSHQDSFIQYFTDLEESMNNEGSAELPPWFPFLVRTVDQIGTPPSSIHSNTEAINALHYVINRCNQFQSLKEDQPGIDAVVATQKLQEYIALLSEPDITQEELDGHYFRLLSDVLYPDTV